MVHNRDVDRIERDTRNWVQGVVVRLNLCPFAQASVNSGSLSVRVQASSDIELVLEQLVEFGRALLEHDEQAGAGNSTGLLVLPTGFDDFETYLDLLELAESLFGDVGLSGHLQIASFHPHYQFEGTAQDDLANYSNRSPYPMLHLLQESSVEWAVSAHADTSTIPQRNVALLRSMTLHEIETLAVQQIPEADQDD